MYINKTHKRENKKYFYNSLQFTFTILCDGIKPTNVYKPTKLFSNLTYAHV